MLSIAVHGSRHQAMLARVSFGCKKKQTSDRILIMIRYLIHLPSIVTQHAVTQIKDEAFVEDINNLLNSGEVTC